MDVFGILAGAAVLLPMFALVCRADRPVDDEDRKVLIGSMGTWED